MDLHCYLCFFRAAIYGDRLLNVPGLTSPQLIAWQPHVSSLVGTSH